MKIGLDVVKRKDRYVDSKRVYELEVQFHNHPDGCLVENEDFEAVVESSEEHSFINRALLYLAGILENPETSIEMLLVTITPPITLTPLAHQDYNLKKDLFLGKLEESLNHQLLVETLEMYSDGNQDDFLAVLSHLKPGTLKTIRFGGPFNANLRHRKNLPIDKIIKTDQWKQIESVWFIRLNMLEPFSVWSDIPDVSLGLPELTVENLDIALQVCDELLIL